MEHLRGILSHSGSFVFPQQVSVSSVYELIDVQGFLNDDDTRTRLKLFTEAFAEFVQKFSGERNVIENFNLRNSVMN